MVISSSFDKVVVKTTDGLIVVGGIGNIVVIRSVNL